jgi:hypothetical protein
MMQLQVIAPQNRQSSRKYILDVFLGEFLGIPFTLKFEDRTTTRITDGTRALQLDDAFFQQSDLNWLKEGSLPRGAFKSLNSVPLLYGHSEVKRDQNSIEVGADLLGSSFFLLTRYEECVRPERDSHGRFPASASVLGQNGFLDRPLVNEYLEIFWNFLKELWPSLERKKRRYTVFLSHDVDHPFGREKHIFGAMKSAASGFVHAKSPVLAAKYLASYAFGRFTGRFDPNDSFDFILNQSRKYGLRSAFYFIPKSRDPERDGGYELTSPRVRKLLSKLAASGAEIGFHGSYHSYDKPGFIQEELKELKRVCSDLGIHQNAWGGRQHYLRWKAPDTWSHWDQAGFTYDSSVSYAEVPGFRCGTCYEFPVFDIRQERALKLRERPLHLMDTTLSTYLNLSASEQWAAVQKVKLICQKYSGTLGILWHNSSLLTRSQKHHYTQIIEAAVRQ